MISVSDVNLTFETNDGPVNALRDVSLKVNEGDFVSFIGPSGCGKTTLLRVIAALETPTSGQVTVNNMSPDDARKAREYGYVFQAAGLYPWRTVSGNIKLPLEIMGYSTSEKEDRVQKVIDLVELKGFEKKFPWQLSGGMQQRASIARALATQPRLLICDEPTSALDVSIQAQILNLLKDLQEQLNLTILFISHDLPVVRQMCNRIGVLKEGELCEVSNAEELFLNPKHNYTKELLRLMPKIESIYK